jgi:hypothetical protein
MKRMFLLSAALVCACGGTSTVLPGAATSSVDVDGTWNATWTSRSGQIGHGTMQLTQSGTTVTGSITVEGSPCVVNADVNGSLDGDALSGTMTFGGGHASFDTTVAATAMSGTYDAVSAGACTGDTGTLSASR